jgi:hypothetical protein
MFRGEVPSCVLEMSFFKSSLDVFFSEGPQALQVWNSTHIIHDFLYLSTFYTYLFAHMILHFLEGEIKLGKMHLNFYKFKFRRHVSESPCNARGITWHALWSRSAGWASSQAHAWGLLVHQSTICCLTYTSVRRPVYTTDTVQYSKKILNYMDCHYLQESPLEGHLAKA